MFVEKAPNCVCSYPVFFSQLIVKFTSFEIEMADKFAPECLMLFIRQGKEKAGDLI